MLISTVKTQFTADKMPCPTQQRIADDHSLLEYAATAPDGPSQQVVPFVGPLQYLPRLEFVQWCLGPDGPFQRFEFVGPPPTAGMACDLKVELRNRRGHMNHVPLSFIFYRKFRRMLSRGNSNAEALSQTVTWLSCPGQIDLVQAAVEYESSLWSLEERKKKVFGDYYHYYRWKRSSDHSD